MTDEPAVTLSTADRIGFLGDTHGNMDHTLKAARHLANQDVRVLIVVGDFGFLWPGQNWGLNLAKLSRHLTRNNQTLYFVDGNHEGFPQLLGFPISQDGLRWVTPVIAHIPRGWRTTLASGRTMAALGGANSIDYQHRIPGRSWWPEETITDTDLTTLGTQPAEVMIGHDAPLNLPTLDRMLATTQQNWSTDALAYAAAGRETFHQGFLHVKPKLYVGGHYHLHVDDTVDYETTDKQPFRCRVVLLNCDTTPLDQSTAVLDVHTLEILNRRR